MIFQLFVPFLLNSVKEHGNIVYMYKTKPNNSRTKQATAIKFWLRLVRVFKSICWRFGVFSIVRSRFIKGHLHRFFGLCRRLNNSRTKKAMTLKFWLRLARVLKSVSWKFGAFSIVCSPFIKSFSRIFCCVETTLKHTFAWNNIYLIALDFFFFLEYFWRGTGVLGLMGYFPHLSWRNYFFIMT